MWRLVRSIVVVLFWVSGAAAQLTPPATPGFVPTCSADPPASLAHNRSCSINGTLYIGDTDAMPVAIGGSAGSGVGTVYTPNDIHATNQSLTNATSVSTAQKICATANGITCNATFANPLGVHAKTERNTQIILPNNGVWHIQDTNNNDIVRADGADRSFSAPVRVKLDTAAAVVLTQADCGRTVRVNNDADAIDYTLPVPFLGCAICFKDDAGGVITVDTATTGETIVLYGTPLTAGNAIDSPGVRGDSICLLGKSTTTWMTEQGQGTWVDGGAD